MKKKAHAREKKGETAREDNTQLRASVRERAVPRFRSRKSVLNTGREDERRRVPAQACARLRRARARPDAPAGPLLGGSAFPTALPQLLPGALRRGRGCGSARAPGAYRPGNDQLRVAAAGRLVRSAGALGIETISNSGSRAFINSVLGRYGERAKRT